MKKRVFITGILVILLALFSILLAASAIFAASQTWYLWNDLQLRTANPTGGSTVTVDSVGVTWQSEQSAQGDVTFGPGDWTGDIGLQSGSPQNHNIMVQIGYVQGSTFNPQGAAVETPASGHFTIQDVPGFTIPNGSYLAVYIYDDDTTPVALQTGSGGSWVTTPDTAPDFPLPELATSILFAGGTGGLGAFIWWRQRRKRQPAG